MRRIYFLFFISLFVQCLTACSDDEINSSALLEIYGCQYDLAEGVIWENNPNIIVIPEPYVYKDVYLNEEGEEVTDEVTGFTVGKEIKTTGNFMLSLYETGLIFNESLQAAVGNGACICFHLSSSDTEGLKPGKYTFSTGKEANTFVAYVSSSYDARENVVPAMVTGGDVSIEKDGEEYVVDFNCETSFGGEIRGAYKGFLHHTRVPQSVSVHYEDVVLAGLLDTVWVTISVPAYGMEETSFSYDTENGTAFFSTASGTVRYAKDKGKESVDIALVWNKEKKCFSFESPIRMRSYTGHDSKYDYPCHTVYMKAPESFTDEDFDNLGKDDFLFDIQEEEVCFGIENFKPGYVFFKAGNGTKGVIKVKDFVPVGQKREEMLEGFIVYTSTANPVLYMDVKCPASFVNPKIR